jgi:hypothetical protein
MASVDRTDYPPALAELLEALPLAPLGPGKPQPALRSKLEAVASAFPPGADRDRVAACRAGLWLAFDFLDEAHAVSQELHTPEGSYWHALMHRREPDYANSKYWFRRVGEHPVFAQLAREAARLGWKAWDPMAFVDECERACGSGSEQERVLREVQQAEWRALFGWCFKRQT